MAERKGDDLDEPSRKRSRAATKDGEYTMDKPSSRLAIDGRDIPVKLGETALVVIDCQELFWDYATEFAATRMKDVVLPNTQRLLKAVRSTGRIEVIYVVVEALTEDGRDNSLFYKSNTDKLVTVPRGGEKAKVIAGIEPAKDDIIIRKTTCSVFRSTNIDYVLRNMGVKHLIFVGVITGVCVESAVRTAADLSYSCTLVEDCCAAQTERDHSGALNGLRVFARLKSTDDVVEELHTLSQS